MSIRSGLQSWVTVRILLFEHEDSSRSVQSHRRRFCREYGSHFELGGASAGARRRAGCVYRALFVRVSAARPPGTPRVYRTEPQRIEEAGGEIAAAGGYWLCRTREKRNREVHWKQSGADLRRACGLRAKQDAFADIRRVRRIALLSAGGQTIRVWAAWRTARDNHLRRRLE